MENTMLENMVELTGENLTAFKKAIKTGYYRDMLKKGIISISEFDILMRMQNK
jgi:hypothetical protein